MGGRDVTKLLEQLDKLSKKQSFEHDSARSSRRFSDKKWVLGVMLIVAVLSVTVWYVASNLLNQQVDCGIDAACFAQQANVCGAARMTSRVATASIELQTNDCVLTKKVVSLDAGEPEEMKELLVGKSMNCRYEETRFNPDVISTMSAGLGSCSGELRDAIEAVIAA